MHSSYKDKNNFYIIATCTNNRDGFCRDLL